MTQESHKRKRGTGKAWPRVVAISDAIQKAEQILEMIDERYKDVPEKRAG